MGAWDTGFTAVRQYLLVGEAWSFVEEFYYSLVVGFKEESCNQSVRKKDSKKKKKKKRKLIRTLFKIQHDRNSFELRALVRC